MDCRHINSFIAIATAVILAAACGKADKVSFDTEIFNETLKDIDKAVTGEELTDIRQMTGDSTTLANHSGRPEYDTKTWKQFVKLCENGKYSKALELFEADADKGDLVLCMPSNDLLYCFHAGIIHPLLKEIKGEEVAAKCYLGLLLFDVNIEEKMMADKGADVMARDYYPAMLSDLGFTMADTGHYDEALELAGKLEEAMQSASGSHIMAIFSKGTYLSQIYNIKGDKDAALQAIEDARILLTRQEMDQLDEQESALLVSCLKNLEDAKSQLMLE